MRRAQLSVELLEDRCLLSAGPGPGAIPAPLYLPEWFGQAVNLETTPKGNPQVVFLGDSITANYAYSPSWAARIAPLGVRDFGIGGSATQNLLWLLNTGVLNGTSPKVIVLMIGIGNISQEQTPEQTAEGVAASVSTIQRLQPQARILLLGILPAGFQADDPVHTRVAQANKLIAGLADGTNVQFLDAGSAFLQADGSISPAVMADGLHPTPLGYQILTGAIEPTLISMLLTAPTTTSVNGVREAVSADGVLTQYDAFGAHALFKGVRSASVAFGPRGEVLDVVFQDGTLTQYDAKGAHALFGGVVAAQVGFGATGEVLDVVFSNSHALQVDAFGSHRLA